MSYARALLALLLVSIAAPRVHAAPHKVPAPAAPDDADAAPEDDDEGEVDHALVRVVGSEGHTEGRPGWTEDVQLVLKVENKLPVAVNGLRFAVELTLASGGKHPLTMSSSATIAPGATTPVILKAHPDFRGDVKTFVQNLESYDLRSLDAPMLAKMIDGSDLDAAMAVRALGLDPLLSDAAEKRAAAKATPGLADGFRKLVAGMPAEPDVKQAIAVAYEVRALGALGAASDLPLLVGLLDHSVRLLDVLAIFALTEDLPDPIAAVMGPGVSWSSTVAAAIRDVDAKAGLAALYVAAAKHPDDDAALNAIQHGWPATSQHAVLLKDVANPELVDALAKIAPRVLLALAAQGTPGAKEALAKVAPQELATSLLPGLTSPPDAASELALTLVAGEKAAEAFAKLEDDYGLHPAAGAALRDRAIAIGAAMVAAEEKVLTTAAASPADGKAAEPGDRLAEIDDALSDRPTPALEARHAAMYVEWATSQITANSKVSNMVSKVLERAALALVDHPQRASADAALGQLAAALTKAGDKPLVRYWLDRLPAMGGDAARVAAAQAFDALSATSPELAAKALALDPKSPRALAIQQEKASEERMAVIVPLFLVLLVAGIGYLIVRSGPAGYTEGICTKCQKPEHVPLNNVSFHYNIGLLVMRMHSKTEGALCKPCITETFWKYFLTNAFLGWWGFISFIVTPFFQLANLYYGLRSWHLPHRKEDAFDVAGAPNR